MEPPPPARMTDEHPTALRRESGTRIVRPGVDVVPKLTLEVRRESGREPRVVVHEGPVCRIGTHSSNDLVLFDPSVSRFHCKLTCDGAGWRVQDSGSLNGTELNGVRIRDADLKGEGTLALGDCVLQARGLEPAIEVAVPDVESPGAFGSLAGTSVAMRKLFAYLEKVAASDINVLIEGESGTGKELVASEIFQQGPRADKAFVIVDCGAISPNLVESELFGHVRGAFTGADRDRIGAFEAANEGTVFLDEIGELPLELQPKLLRAIEARAIRRVGETRARKVDVRVIAATNRDLHREVNRGRFREDLYFRLAVMTVQVPPLRERIEDLPALVRSFLTGARRHRPGSARSVLAERPGGALRPRLAGQRARAAKLRRALRGPARGAPGLEATRPRARLARGGRAGPLQARQGRGGRHLRAKLPVVAARFDRGQHQQGGAQGRHGPDVPAPPHPEARPADRPRASDDE